MAQLNNHAEELFERAYKLLLDEHTSKTAASLKQAANRRTQTLDDMQIYLQRAEIRDYDKIPLIHITGTKGKGSTAAISEGILRNVQKYRTGLFTSPHLLDIRERIRLDGQPVSKQEFADAYFILRRRLLKYSNQSNENQKDGDLPPLPGYFRMLTLIALYIFTSHQYPPDSKDPTIYKGVDVMIMEVGMGGRYDATNLFHKSISNSSRPFAAGVTLIDLDHTRVLGNTLEQIAWEKGGIFRHSTSSSSDNATDLTEEQSKIKNRFFTIGTNTANVIQVLQKCCLETYDTDEAQTESEIQNFSSQTLKIVQTNQQIPSDWSIGLKGSHQRLNAELALALCKLVHSQIMMLQKFKNHADSVGMNFRQRNTDASLDFDEKLLKEALAKAFWPGRCQTVSVSNTPIKIHCDGAHTTESMKECVKWLRTISDTTDSPKTKSSKRILIFNCSHERNPVTLLNYLLSIYDNDNHMDQQKHQFFTQVYFCKADSERPSMVSKASALDLLLEAGYDKNAILHESSSLQRHEKGTWQDTLAHIWMVMRSMRRTHAINSDCSVNDSNDEVFTNKSVKEALEMILQQHGNFVESEIHVCVTGSLYIVGSALNATGWEEISAPCSHTHK